MPAAWVDWLLWFKFQDHITKKAETQDQRYLHVRFEQYKGLFTFYQFETHFEYSDKVAST